jgi:hypothetical protein
MLLLYSISHFIVGRFFEAPEEAALQECQWQGATDTLTRTYSQRLLGRCPPLTLYHTDTGNALGAILGGIDGRVLNA